MTDLHEWLDQQALSTGPRTELRPETRLWHIFGWDREYFPRRTYPTCPSCGTPVRRHDQLAKYHPGTRKSARSDRVCEHCRESRHSKRTEIVIGEPCADCRQPLRPGGMRLSDAPGTVRHTGRGLCSSCYKRLKRKKG